MEQIVSKRENLICSALTDQFLELILLPTEKCNFRCTYCYEDFSIGKMKPDVVSGIKNLIKNRIRDLKHLSISWFGGEPLLAKDICYDIGSLAFESAKQTGCQFRGAMTTNGYLLTPDVFRNFLDIGHTAYQITLDGDETWHNRTRVLANKRGTFSVIWENLAQMQKQQDEFMITLRLHLHRANIESQRELYKKLSSTLLLDKRFSVYFHKVSDLNPEKDVGVELLPDQDYSQALAYVMGENYLEYETQEKEPISEIHLKDYICYAAKPNSLLIRADGTLGKCTVALNDERNKVGRLCSDGSLEISNPKLQVWFEGYRNLDFDVLGCPLSTLGQVQSPLTIRVV